MKSILNWGSTTVRGWVVNNKKRRLLALYEKGKYTDMAKLFKGEKDYVAVTFDKFPFLYYIISNFYSMKARVTKKQFQPS